MNDFIYQVLYYLNMETPEYWERFHFQVLLIAALHCPLILNYNFMEQAGVTPRFLRAFPYTYIFPTTIPGVIGLVIFYILLFFAVPEIMTAYIEHLRCVLPITDFPAGINFI